MRAMPLLNKPSLEDGFNGPAVAATLLKGCGLVTSTFGVPLILFTAFVYNTSKLRSRPFNLTILLVFVELLISFLFCYVFSNSGDNNSFEAFLNIVTLFMWLPIAITQIIPLEIVHCVVTLSCIPVLIHFPLLQETVKPCFSIIELDVPTLWPDFTPQYLPNAPNSHISLGIL
jgi:hypothetical protein